MIYILFLTVLGLLLILTIKKTSCHETQFYR